MTTARTIKRYANRKLYDTRDSRYVTLDHIAAMVRAGDDVRVVENTTRADLTTATLAQIIFEEEKKAPRLSVAGLRKIIQGGMPAADWASISHQYMRYQVNVVATFPPRDMP